MTIAVKVPSVGESITEVTISQWLKKDGDFVEIDDPICEIDSDKATVEVTAEKSGVLRIKVQAGQTVPIGQVIAEIDPEAKGQQASSPKGEAAPASKPKVITPDTISPESIQTGEDKRAKDLKEQEAQTLSHVKGHPSPAAQKILNEKGINPQEISGTGKGGRVTKEDALSASAKSSQETLSSSKVQLREVPSPQSRSENGERGIRSEKMTTLRKTIAKRLVEAKNTTAMLTTFNEVDMFAIMELRKKYKDLFKEKHQVGLGFMSFFTKAVVQALKEFPAINAMIDGDNIVYHDYYDIGIAVSTPRGLVVPIIRDSQHLSLADIEKTILELANKARINKLSIAEMTGGTFTITNGGVFGSMLSTPILNSPQSAILGMHNIVERPVAINGEVRIRPIMYVALSYDHRIVDGRESVSFLKKIKEYIEDPARLLLDV